MNIKSLKQAKEMGVQEIIREEICEIKTKINKNKSSGRVEYHPKNKYNVNTKVLDGIVKYFKKAGFEAQWTSSIIIIVEW